MADQTVTLLRELPSIDRYLIVGESRQGRLLIVSYTERRDAVRLISAREVTLSERKTYEEG